MKPNRASDLEEIYRRLYRRFGPQSWWPGETRLEIMVGAVLTQNTNWTNVEKAILSLKKARALSVAALEEIPVKKLAALIRPSGYFNIKAKRLKNFIRFIVREYGGNCAAMKKTPLPELRKKLLSVNGIGPETADSILLYALDKPVFVIDAYTKRFLSRHNFIARDADYHAVQELFASALKPDVQKFNEYHALIVHLGKHFCRTKPSCEACPLHDFHYTPANRCGQCYRSLLQHERKCHACQ